MGIKIGQINKYMLKNFTICTYHTILSDQDSKFPEFKGTSYRNFIGQLDFFKRYYNIISFDELMSCINDKKIPPKSLLLTFDDAYRNHFEIALPELTKRNLSGLFFVPGKVIMNKKILDVNKIHLIISNLDTNIILKEIFLVIKKERSVYKLQSDKILYNNFVKAGKKAGYRWDTDEIIFIKQALQKLLPKSLRKKIIDILFTKIYGNEEENISSNIYMNVEEAKEMLNNKMYIGAHGFEHDWLNSMSKAEQNEEILKSCEMLQSFKIREEHWSISFPYGGYDKNTIEICNQYNFKMGFSIQPKVVDLSKDQILCLPRLDTNDFPCDSYSNPPIHYYYS